MGVTAGAKLFWATVPHLAGPGCHGKGCVSPPHRALVPFRWFELITHH